ncbi:unnamed protein product [Sphagnum tenellum]
MSKRASSSGDDERRKRRSDDLSLPSIKSDPATGPTMSINMDPTIKMRSIMEAMGPKISINMGRTLLDLPDGILLLILRQLTPRDLLRMSETCLRLSKVAADWRLWAKVRVDTPMTREELAKLSPFLNARTKSVRVTGLKVVSEAMSPDFMISMATRCPDLEELTLDACFLDAKEVPITMFPAGVKILGITNSDVVVHGQDGDIPYFDGVCGHLRRLQELDLSGGDWVTSGSLRGLHHYNYVVNGQLVDSPKSEGLRSLKMRGCNNADILRSFFVKNPNYRWFDYYGNYEDQDVCQDILNRGHYENSIPRGITSLDVRDQRREPVNRHWLSVADLRLTHLYLGYTRAPRPQEVQINSVNDKSLMIFIMFHIFSTMDEMDVPQPKDSFIEHITLAYTEITDRAMPRLAALPALRHLDVTGTKVTAAGVEAFKAIKPGCKVIWGPA